MIIFERDPRIELECPVTINLPNEGILGFLSLTIIASTFRFDVQKDFSTTSSLMVSKKNSATTHLGQTIILDRNVSTYPNLQTTRFDANAH